MVSICTGKTKKKNSPTTKTKSRTLWTFLTSFVSAAVEYQLIHITYQHDWRKTAAHRSGMGEGGCMQ